MPQITTQEQVHDAFRCWITTEPHPKFPINLLQCSIKYTAEPPQGVKAGLKRTYGLITQVRLGFFACICFCTVCTKRQHTSLCVTYQIARCKDDASSE